MNFRLSEYGKRYTDFDDIQSGIDYCEKNQLTNGRHGILWIFGDDIDRLTQYIKENESRINNKYMSIAIENQYVYSYEEWIPWSEWFN